MVHCQNDLRNQRSRHCFDKARAGANDSGVLSIWSNHATGDVLYEQQRGLVSITRLDEVGDLLRRYGVDNSAKPLPPPAGRADHPAMIGDHSNLDSTNTSVTGDHLLRVVGLKLVQMATVEQTLEQFSYVVRLSVIFRNDVV